MYFFFFSSRRRHTRSLCDWSSDVCSSDLVGLQGGVEPVTQDAELERVEDLVDLVTVPAGPGQIGYTDGQVHVAHQLVDLLVTQHGREVLTQRVAGLAL